MEGENTQNTKTKTKHTNTTIQKSGTWKVRKFILWLLRQGGGDVYLEK